MRDTASMYLIVAAIWLAGFCVYGDWCRLIPVAVSGVIGVSGVISQRKSNKRLAR